MVQRDFQIRPMTEGDIDEAALFLGEPNRELLLKLYVEQSKDNLSHPMVAVVNPIHGTLVSNRHGGVGWLGHLKTQPPAGPITDAMIQDGIDWCTAQGCNTIVCVSDATGLKNQFNFVDQPEKYRLFWRDPPFQHQTPGGVRGLSLGDLNDVVTLDQAATGEDRRDLLRPWINQGWGVPDHGQGSLRAFYIPMPVGWAAPGAGPTITSNNSATPIDDALALIAQQSRLNPIPRYINAVVLSSNAAGIAALQANGFTEFSAKPNPPVPGAANSPQTRAIRGPALNWQPNNIWGIFGLSFG